MASRYFGLEHSLVVRLGAFAQSDQTVAFPHLVADAGAFGLVALAFLVSLLIEVGGFEILLPAKGKVGVLCGVSALCVEVGVDAAETEDGMNDE